MRLLEQNDSTYLVLAEFFVQEFDSDLAIEFRVLGEVHLTHSTRADLRDDAVMRQSCIGC